MAIVGVSSIVGRRYKDRPQPVSGPPVQGSGASCWGDPWFAATNRYQAGSVPDHLRVQV